ncbi:MAG: hypothetical protein RIQ99_833 [Pseudomonadota bacterium]
MAKSVRDLGRNCTDSDKQSFRAFLKFGVAALVTLAAPVCAANTPAQNPFLAASPNNQSHWNDAATDSTEAAVPKGHYCMLPDGAAIFPSDGMGIPAYGATLKGVKVYWFFTGTALRKLQLVNGQFTEIDRRPIRQSLPGMTVLSREQRLAQFDAIHAYLQAGDEAGLAKYLADQPNRLTSSVEDQVQQGVLYSLFTRDHGFIGANARGLVQIDNIDPADPLSKLGEPRYASLPDRLFDDAKVSRGSIFPTDAAFGLGMTFNGYVVVSTLGGKIATFDRRTLELVDVFTAPGSDELFTNGFATSEEIGSGAVYIASNHFMYRLVVDAAGKIHADAAHGAWSAAYDRGVRLPIGKIADGTGSTPTLMGFGPGDDKLVVITDGAQKMRLVAFWRDRLPVGWRGRPGFASQRIADQITVDLGPDFPIVQSEQSVVARAGHAFVLNSMLPPSEQRPYPGRGSYLRGLLQGATRPLPSGIAMFRWNGSADRWALLWHRTDISSVATVPFLSGGSSMVVLNGAIKPQRHALYHLGFDQDTGKLVMSIGSAIDPRFNGAFTGVKTDDDGSLMYTTIFGLVRFDVTKMKHLPDPPGAGRKDCD